ncbi:MAG TPA: hypothetical protein VH575_32830 [Gemmataceae bacterium]|jgi:hypothetical protein
MSIFYLLPPRPFLGDRFAAFLQTFFPGLDWDRAERDSLAELLGVAADGRDVYVVYRDDLPRDESAAQALVNGFGAEPGDEVVEVRPCGQPYEMIARRWRVSSNAECRMQNAE